MLASMSRGAGTMKVVIFLSDLIDALERDI